MNLQKEIIEILAQGYEEELWYLNFILSVSQEVEAIKKTEMTKMPFHLNLLDTALEGNMRETAHSRFLWQLLRIKEILEKFAKRFFHNNFIVTEKYKLNIPDKFRIDISLQTESDFFIFENKVNDAEEQRGQIYRYVTSAIKKGYKPDHIHVLYLNSKTHDLPSKYSLTKDGKGKEYISHEVKVNVISYKEEIVDWLSEIYNEIPNEEVFLKTSIFQYLDYLKEKFHISKRYSKMNSKIQSLLMTKLFNETMDSLQRLNVIGDTKAQLEQLMSFLEKLEEKEESKRFQEWFDQLITLYPIENYNWIRDDEYDIHIDFKFHGYSLSACLTIDNGVLCWGIKCKNKVLPKKWANDLYTSVQLFLPRAQYEEWWPAWDKTSYENGLERFITLMKWVIENQD